MDHMELQDNLENLMELYMLVAAVEAELQVSELEEAQAEAMAEKEPIVDQMELQILVAEVAEVVMYHIHQAYLELIMLVEVEAQELQ